MTCQAIYSVANDAPHEHWKTGLLAAENKTPHPPHIHTHRFWPRCNDAPAVCAPSQSIWDLHRIPNSLHHVAPERKIIGKCLGISYNKACEHRLGDESALLVLNTNQRQHTTTARLWSDQLPFCTPCKGLLAPGRARGRSSTEKGSPGHAAHCRAPSRNAASSHGWNGDLGTPGPELPNPGSSEPHCK